ncbi:MAG: HD domain-containing protein [Thermoplasmata archaeon]
MEYKIIQDPVMGPIRLDGVIRELIDTREFQRLRRIKSLGLCNVVFPGANHTRFEHSIGTYFLATKYISHFNMNDEEFLIAALLHDIGHFPFSHTIEEFYLEKYNIDHLDAGISIIEGKNSDIPEIIEKYGFSVNKVTKILKKQEYPVLSSLISGPVDVDELDYLRRDSFFCGVSMGYANPDRIIAVSSVDNDDVIVEEKGIFDIESLLVSRFLMYQAVYFHKTCRIANKMLETAIRKWADENESYKFDDANLIESLIHDENSKRMIDRILNRDLMKVAAKIKYSRENYKIVSEALRSVENTIVDIIPPLSFNGRERIKIDLKIRISGEITVIEEVSPLIKSLLEAMDRRYIYVYSDEKDREDVAKLLEKIL